MDILDFFKKKITVATHNGSFHADDVFACATLSIWAEKEGMSLKIVRTRDERLLDKAQITVDVGMKYDSEKNKFDHHQKEGAGTHENGIPYAAFGLIWKHYGEKICGKEIARVVKQRLVMPFDARDNGIAISKANDLGIFDHRTDNAISGFNQTWQENDGNNYDQFIDALKFAIKIIQREIAWAAAEIEGAKLTKKAIENQNDPDILILEKYFEWEKTVSRESMRVKFVVYKHRNGDDWCVQSVRNDLENYDSNRANLPENWWSLEDNDLTRISGIKDVVFCSNGGWFAIAKTKEGALEMACKALDKQTNMI